MARVEASLIFASKPEDERCSTLQQYSQIYDKDENVGDSLAYFGREEQLRQREGL